MKVRKMMLMAALSVALTGAVGCSSESDTIKGTDCQCSGNTTILTDSVEVSFCLLGKDLKSTNTFNQGENIIFNLTVRNRTDKDIILPAYMLGNLFEVYTFDGNRVGTPYDGIGMQPADARMFSVPKNKTFQWMCPWVHDTDIEVTSPSSYYIYQNGGNKSLPAGEYVAVVMVDLGSHGGYQQLLRPFVVK